MMWFKVGYRLQTRDRVMIHSSFSKLYRKSRTTPYSLFKLYQISTVHRRLLWIFHMLFALSLTWWGFELSTLQKPQVILKRNKIIIYETRRKY